MYITITDILGEMKINLAYLIKGKEVVVVTVFSYNVQYDTKEPLNILLITNEEKLLLKGKFTSRELSTFVGRMVITTSLDTKENVLKTNKLTGITEMVINLDELDNTDNLENGRLSSVLLRYYVTDSEEFMTFEPVTYEYKRLKNLEFSSLTLKIMDQKGNTITNGPGMTIVLNIR